MTLDGSPVAVGPCATMSRWQHVENAVLAAVRAGKIADWRHRMPQHPTKRFRSRRGPEDILGVCTHQSASKNQDPMKTAQYHVFAPNHVSQTGCPGFLYGAAISNGAEPDKVILCNDFDAITWSQGRPTRGNEAWAGDENRHLFSVVVMGDFPERGRKGRTGSPSDSQLHRWLWFVEWLSGLFGFGAGGHFGHYHFGKMLCPGRDLRRQIEIKRESARSLSDLEWQEHLLRWYPDCLPVYGADGDWGMESKCALVAFERQHKHRADGLQDPFTELLLTRRYGPR